MKHFFLFILFSISQPALAGHPSQLYTDIGYELFQDHGKQGLKSNDGKIIIPAKYEALGWSKGRFEVVNNTIGYQEDYFWGLISLDNEIITGAEYTNIYPGGQDLIIASQSGKVSRRDFYGLITTSGKILLPFKYASVKLEDQRAIISEKRGNKYLYGVVDLGGKEIIPISYKEINALGRLRFAVKNTEDKIAIFNEKGSRILNFDLDSISAFNSGYAIIYKNHQAGLINTEGIIASPVISKAFDLSGSVPKVLSFNDWLVLDEKRQVLNQFAYDSMRPFSDNAIQVFANRKTWLIDSTGSPVTPLNINILGDLHGKHMIFKVKNKWGVIEKNGEVLIPAKFDSVFLNDNMIYLRERVNGSYLWSLYDNFGVRKSEQYYEAIGHKSGHLYPVKKRGYWGYINRSGEEVIHCVYDDVSTIIEGKLVVKYHDEYGVIDKLGEWVILPQKEPVKIINSNFFLEYSRNLTSLKSFDDELIYFTENDVEIFDNYLLEHLEDGTIWKVDFSGQIVNKGSSSDKYQEIRVPSEGLYPAKIDDRYGFIDNQNRLRIANRYDDVGNFHEGLAAFKLLGRWGFIDKQESIRVQPLYETVTDFKDGLAVASDRDGMGLLGTHGQRESVFEYDSVYREENGRFVIVKNGKKGLINKKGRLVINAKYDELRDLGNGYVVAKKFGKYGLVNIDGVDVIPLIYDQLFYNPGTGQYLAMKKSEWKEVDLP